MAEAVIKPPKQAEPEEDLISAEPKKSEFRVMVDVLEKVLRHDAKGNAINSVHSRGDVITYDDEERAAHLVSLGVLAPVEEATEADAAVANPAPNAVNDTTNGGAAGGLAVPGPAIDTGTAPEEGVI